MNNYVGVLEWSCEESWCRGGGDSTSHQADAFSESTCGEVWQGSGVAEAAIQDEPAEAIACARGGGEEDLSATEESIPPVDGATSRDRGCACDLLPNVMKPAGVS